MASVVVALMVLSMVIVLLVAWKWFGFLKAFMIMLLVGKVWAGVLYAFGIDKPLFNIIIYNKLRHTETVITVTACQAIFISFLITLATTFLNFRNVLGGVR